MQRSTREKIEKINTRLIGGANDKEIADTFFSRSIKKWEEYKEKHQDYIQIMSPVEIEELELLEEVHQEEEPKEKIEVLDTYKKKDRELSVVHSKEEYRDLRKLIEKAPDILKLLEGGKAHRGDKDLIEGVYVPDKLIKIKDLRIRTYRVSTEIEREFDEIVSKNPQYSKTSLINLMFKEFVDKYKG